MSRGWSGPGTTDHRGTATTVIVLLLILPLCGATVSGWSNGGYSADPEDPDYGTHDWMAEHALDWLPMEEKRYLLDNMSAYLYGTELPDNGGASDGIGDSWWHHVYFNTDGTVMYYEDDSAWRAITEYNDTMDHIENGNMSDAAKNAGIMTHYIADVSVWAHVMGGPTSDTWGQEEYSVHSGYEDHVRDRTTSYTSDDFDPFLEFDGELETIDAYNATIEVARNTTFGENGRFNCTWMNATANNWSNTDFFNRTGRLLNLGVNAIADVLHTLAVGSGYAASQVNRTPVKINEVELDPEGGDAGNEWIEVFNPTGETADLSRWYLENADGDVHTFPNETLLPGGDYMNVSPAVQWLDNVDGQVLLQTPYGDEVDATPVLDDESDDHRTWARVPNGVDTNTSADWTFQKGTRNRTNDLPPPPVNVRPVATFTVVPEEGNTSTNFVANASGSHDPDGDDGNLTFEWDWGDGTANSTGMAAEHSYADPGNYTITLVVDDHNGTENTTNSTDRRVNVGSLPPPPDEPPEVHWVEISPPEPTFEDHVHVTVNVTDDHGLSRVLVRQRATDGPDAGTWTNTTMLPSGEDDNVYEALLGPYPKGTDITLHIVATDTANASVREPSTGNLSISVAPNILPVPVLDVDPIHVMVLQEVGFNATLSRDPDGNVTGYLFDFGDGNTSSWQEGAVLDHVYRMPGEFDIVLSVRDDDGAVNTSIPIKVLVDPLPPPNHGPCIEVLDHPDNITVNETLDLVVEVSDPDGDELIVTLTGDPPAGLVLDEDRHLVWTPTALQLGKHTITVEVTDGELTTVYEFTIEVLPEAEEPPPPDDGDGDEEGIPLWTYVLGMVLIFVVIVFSFVFLYRLKEG